MRVKYRNAIINLNQAWWHTTVIPTFRKQRWWHHSISLLPPQCYKPIPSHQVQSSFSSKLFLFGLPVPFANYAILRFGFKCYYLLEEKTNHIGYCNMMFSEGLRRWYYKLNEKYRAKKRIGPSGDATAPVLLSWHNMCIKLTSKYLCLCSQVNTAISFSQKSFLLQWVAITAKCVNPENKRLVKCTVIAGYHYHPFQGSGNTVKKQKEHMIQREG